MEHVTASRIRPPQTSWCTRRCMCQRWKPISMTRSPEAGRSSLKILWRTWTLTTTPVEDVGRIAQEAEVKTLVLSHLVPATDGITDDTWRSAAAKYFKGEIIVGKDLMVVW